MDGVSPRRWGSPHGETEVCAPQGERSYVSTPNKNSFDIQITSAFFADSSLFKEIALILHRVDCLKERKIYKRIKLHYRGEQMGETSWVGQGGVCCMNDKILQDYGRAKRPESNGAKEGDERSKRFRREAFSRTTLCAKLEEGVAMK
ncbi:hypothetical protein DBV15_00117 [Temnothorax longispinosus]|uniref:Uncharacterized protein n=1 Tax=Temnothorax longispinosus TaxID=300112 RepID=A0A4S2KE05_9HYME|nr:hypothetical protein DBV15_00117 [Temnothorax longispinosus]